MYGYHHFAGGNWPMLVSSLVFWMLLTVAVAAIIWMLAGAGRPWAGAAAGPAPVQPGRYPPRAVRTPADILAERFARGDIDEQEFLSRMAALRSGSPGRDVPPPAS